MKRIIALLLTLLLILALTGCAEEQIPVDPTITESLVVEEALPLNHGVLEYEKLTPQPWYCGCLEFIGRCRWAETQNGYYYYDGGELSLYYADKTDLQTWVPVCDKPNCSHTFAEFACHSHLGYDGFWIRDGRICYPKFSDMGIGMQCTWIRPEVSPSSQVAPLMARTCGWVIFLKMCTVPTEGITHI